MDEKEAIQKAAALFKILGDETRLNILNVLSEEPMNVTSLVEKTGYEQSNISHHLKTLKEYRLVRSKRDGKSIIYSPDDEHVYRIIEQVLEHVEE